MVRKKYEFLVWKTGKRQIIVSLRLVDILNYKELFGSKLEFRSTWSETALYSKNLKFHKI